MVVIVVDTRARRVEADVFLEYRVGVPGHNRLAMLNRRRVFTLEQLKVFNSGAVL